MVLRVTKANNKVTYPTGKVGEIIEDNLKSEDGKTDYQIVRAEDGHLALKKVKNKSDVTPIVVEKIPEVKKDVRVLKKVR